MKIAILCSNIIPNGGTERAICNLTKLLSCDARYEISLISFSSNNRDIPKFDFNRCPIYHLGLSQLQRNSLKKIKWYLTAIKTLVPLIRDISPDIILGYGHNINIILPFLRKRHVKVYGCEHINYDTIPQSSKLIMRLLYPKLNGIIVLSKTAQHKYQHLHKKIFIIPNILSFYSQKTSLLKNDRIIMLGRLSPEKGYERLVPIAHRLELDYPSWKIDIFGDGPLKDQLLELYNKENVINVISIKGSTNDIQDELMNSSILLMTSYTEALPMAIIEAKACGVPAVAYENEGTKELIIDGVDGCLANNNDELYFKLSALISNRDLLCNFSMNAYKNAEKFKGENIKHLWDSLFLNN